MGQSWPKRYFKSLSYPKCLVKSSLSAVALGKVGNWIRKAPRLLTRLLSSPPAPSPATGTSSVRTHAPSHSSCLLHPSLQCSPPLHQASKPLLPRLGASPAAHQPSQTHLPASSEKLAQFFAFQSSELSPQRFLSLTTVLVSSGEVNRETETVTAR